MLTKNFYSLMMTQMSGIPVTNGIVDATGTVNGLQYGTNIYNNSLKMLYKLMTGTGTGETASGVRIGSGVTPATLDDYNMEKQLTSGFTVVNQSAASVTMGDDCIDIFASYTVTNNGTVAISISEIGLFGAFMDSGGNYKLCMLEHTVLESPITIKPGEAKTLTYTLRFNYHTA